MTPALTTESARLASLKDVLARVEAATGPNQELDARALCAIACPGGIVEKSRFNGVWCIYQGEYKGQPRSWEYRGGWHRPEGWPLTSSLDACVDLANRVLPGFFWIVAKGRIAATEPLFGAKILRDDITIAEAETDSGAALALLTAILRAIVYAEEKRVAP